MIDRTVNEKIVDWLDSLESVIRDLDQPSAGITEIEQNIDTLRSISEEIRVHGTTLSVKARRW